MEEPVEVRCMLWAFWGPDSGAFVVLECCTLKVKVVVSETSGNASASESSTVGVQYQIICSAFWVAADI
jgi:hypothetical protein